MKLQNLIKQVENDGWEVFIDHEREYKHGPAPNSYSLSPRGGRTIATIYKEGVVIVGKSECSKHDNYNRKIGASIALGRAKKVASLFRIVN